MSSKITLNFKSQYIKDTDPPTLQWLNGSLKKGDNPLIANGCFEFPIDRFGGFERFSEEPTFNVNHDSLAYLMPQISVAILASREAWFIKHDRWEERIDPNGPFRKGDFSKFQIFALIQELGGEPAILTSKSNTAKYLKESVEANLGRVIRLANGFNKGDFPEYCFWLPLIAKEKTEVGTTNKQEITPPIVGLMDFSKETINGLFVGNDLAEKCESMMPQALRWAEQWAKTPEEDEGQNGTIKPTDIYEDANGNGKEEEVLITQHVAEDITV